MGWQGLLFVVIMGGPRLMEQPSFQIIMVSEPERERAFGGSSALT